MRFTVNSLFTGLTRANALATASSWLPKAAGVVMAILVGYYTAFSAWVETIPVFYRITLTPIAIFCAYWLVSMPIAFIRKILTRQRRLNFKWDIQTLALLSGLLASVRDDALNYLPYNDKMNERLASLEGYKGVFLDSPCADAFNSFMRDARTLIGGKEGSAEGLIALLFKERSMFAESLNRNYNEMKRALDHDYTQRNSTPAR